MIALLVQSEGFAHSGRLAGKTAKQKTAAKTKTSIAKDRASRFNATGPSATLKVSLNVYHASNAKFSPAHLKVNSNGLLHVSTRASFSAQYGANLIAFKLRDKKLFRLGDHQALIRAKLGDHKFSTAEGSLGINVHQDFKLHATLKDLGFRGYEYKQYDNNRDRYITNFALFDAKHLVLNTSP